MTEYNYTILITENLFILINPYNYFVIYLDYALNALYQSDSNPFLTMLSASIL